MELNPVFTPIHKSADCSFEIRIAEDAHVFIFHNCLLSINYDLRKRSNEGALVRAEEQMLERGNHEQVVFGVHRSRRPAAVLP